MKRGQYLSSFFKYSTRKRQVSNENRQFQSIINSKKVVLSHPSGVGLCRWFHPAHICTPELVKDLSKISFPMFSYLYPFLKNFQASKNRY